MTTALILFPLGLAAAASAQVPVQPIGGQGVIAPIDNRVVAPIDLKARLSGCAMVPGGSAGIIGEDGSAEIIGEKVIGEKVIGEKVIGEKIIGEKIIGEKGRSPALSFGHRWKAGGAVSYKHVIAGPPGRYTVQFYGCSSAPGGQVLELSAPDAGLQQSLLAGSAGAARSAVLTLRAGPTGIARAPLTITVADPAGAPAAGVYKVTITH